MRAVLFIILFSLAGCSAEEVAPRPAFYYWRNDFRLSAEEQEWLAGSGAQRLYTRFFDVDVSTGGKPVPATVLSGLHALPGDVEIVPCIYITPETFRNLDSLKVEELADQCGNLMHDMVRYARLEVKEVQVDCDWTGSIRDRYFYFLGLFKKKNPQFILSVTVRLYPFKYYQAMGVPPGDRAMLMCYNLIRPAKKQWRNAILDIGEARKYLGRDINYPLPLDFAVPLFSWGGLFRKGQFHTLIPALREADLAVRRELVRDPDHPLRFVCIKPVELPGIYLYPGDEIRIDDVNFDEIDALVPLLKKQASSKDPYLAFFHLDAKNLPGSNYEKITAIIGHFN